MKRSYKPEIYRDAYSKWVIQFIFWVFVTDDLEKKYSNVTVTTAGWCTVAPPCGQREPEHAGFRGGLFTELILSWWIRNPCCLTVSLYEEDIISRSVLNHNQLHEKTMRNMTFPRKETPEKIHLVLTAICKCSIMTNISGRHHNLNGAYLHDTLIGRSW